MSINIPEITSIDNFISGDENIRNYIKTQCRIEVEKALTKVDKNHNISDDRIEHNILETIQKVTEHYETLYKRELENITIDNQSYIIPHMYFKPSNRVVQCNEQDQIYSFNFDFNMVVIVRCDRKSVETALTERDLK